MYKDLLKLERLPHSWCPGCGIGSLMKQFAMVLDEKGMNYTNTVLVSGVGCGGRLPSYMKFDGVYALHGRPLPVAEAIKMVNPSLNVIVVSGDGDLASIGGNHLLHTARRDPRLTVIMNTNEVYALTGGQVAPTSRQGARTITTPRGSPFPPIDVQTLLKATGRYFYARTTIYHQGHFRDCVKEALAWPGFAFVEAITDCIENNGRRIGFKTAYEMLVWYRQNYKRAPEGTETLGPFEIGIVRRE